MFHENFDLSVYFYELALNWMYRQENKGEIIPMNFGCFCIYRLVANGISDKIFEEKILQEKITLHTFPSIKKLLRSQRAQKCNFVRVRLNIGFVKWGPL